MITTIIAIALCIMAAAAAHGIYKNGKFNESKKNFTVDIDRLILE